jgi:hypothetical protein
MGIQPVRIPAKSVKATIVLDPATLASIIIPDGAAKLLIEVEVDGRVVLADLNAKSLRRAVKTITTEGPEKVGVIVQGRLSADNVLLDAGIQAQPRAPKTA